VVQAVVLLDRDSEMYPAWHLHGKATSAPTTAPASAGKPKPWITFQTKDAATTAMKTTVPSSA